MGLLVWPPIDGPKLWCIVPLWRGQTVTIIGGGPSLTPEQVNMVRGHTRVIAVNDAYKLAPWADILYACDAKWWSWHNGASDYEGIKVGLKWNAVSGKHHKDWDKGNYSSILSLASTGIKGLELCPNAVKTGSNSGYQAINMAFHLGVKRILLLGYDLKDQNGKHHWFGDHPDKVPPPYTSMKENFKTLAKPLEKEGIEVINCTPDSALDAFTKMSLGEYFA